MAAKRVQRLARYRTAIVTFLTERDGEGCRLCGATDQLEIDHIIPIADDGPDRLDNYRLLCKSCNGRGAGRPSLSPDRPCTKCGRKPFPILVEFSYRTTPAGRRVRQSHCNDCRGQLNRARREAR